MIVRCTIGKCQCHFEILKSTHQSVELRFEIAKVLKEYKRYISVPLAMLSLPIPPQKILPSKKFAKLGLLRGAHKLDFWKKLGFCPN